MFIIIRVRNRFSHQLKNGDFLLSQTTLDHPKGGVFYSREQSLLRYLVRHVLVPVAKMSLRHGVLRVFFAEVLFKFFFLLGAGKVGFFVRFLGFGELN